jgi:haloalkane dehalogenase
MKAQPEWLDKKLFPFTSRWIEIDGNEIHYIDEGKGALHR